MHGSCGEALMASLTGAGIVQKDFSEELKRECAAIKKSADLNKAAASLKLHNYKDAISAASKVCTPQQVIRTSKVWAEGCVNTFHRDAVEQPLPQLFHRRREILVDCTGGKRDAKHRRPPFPLYTS